MFVRIKTTPNSPRKSVQIVESFREGNAVRQRIVRHVGIAADDQELETLQRLAHHIRAKMLHKKRPSLFPPEQVAALAIESGRKRSKKRLPIEDLSRLKEEHRTILGIHEAYGQVYQDIGLDQVLPAGRNKVSSQVLHHTVMARIAQPKSKRATVRRLQKDFGVHIPLEKIYRMMDRLDDGTIARIRDRIGESTRSMLPNPIDLVLFDCTTLFFESQQEGALRACGYSKDGKHNSVQVVLALAVTRCGLPLGYEVFPGNSWEGDSFLPTLRTMQPDTAQAAIVADAGMFSKDNLEGLAASGCKFAVGARLRNLPKALTGRILDTSRYRAVPGCDRKVGVFRHGGNRLLVTWSRKRAAKDAHDRRRAVEKLVRRLGKSATPKQLLGKSGRHRYVRVVGESRIEVDEEKIRSAGQWDGLKGIVTNIRGIGITELLDRYRQLWQVEESFRITKHDLRVRPIFHWTDRRIRAHLAISFMAYACVRHLGWRVALQKQPMSPQVIREALMDRQCSVLKDPENGKRYVIPSQLSGEGKAIYGILGLPASSSPYELLQTRNGRKSSRS